ncbi:MAG: hypothetical protein OES13_09475 [Acidimicrobiia bacterium]|nr:hypothetical protein [Acidimicrobiia bacterium]
MQTIEKKPDSISVGPDPSVRGLRTRNRWLVLAVAVLLLASLGLGAALLLGGDDDTFAAGVDGAVVDEITELLDDMAVAWGEGDGAAVVAMMAEDGFHISDGTRGEPITGDGLESFASRWASINWTRTDPTMIDPTESPGEYIVMESVIVHPDSVGTEDRDTTIVLYRIVEENGALKVAEQVAFESIRWPLS